MSPLTTHQSCKELVDLVKLIPTLSLAEEDESSLLEIVAKVNRTLERRYNALLFVKSAVGELRLCAKLQEFDLNATRRELSAALEEVEALKAENAELRRAHGSSGDSSK